MTALPTSDASDAPLSRTARTEFDHHPVIAVWELTQACDQACGTCRSTVTKDRDPLELTTDEGMQLLDEIEAMGTPLVVFTGGDPGKRLDLVELVEHAASLGLSTVVTPSGTSLMTLGLLEELQDAGLSRVAVSVDGPNAPSHDGFRKVSGSFAESVRILDQARTIALETQVNSSIDPRNAGALADMAAFVKDVGAVLWRVSLSMASVALGPQGLERTLEQLAEIAETAPFGVKTFAAPGFRRVLLAHHSRGKRTTVHDLDEGGRVTGHRGVNDGLGALFVSHRGDIFPSGALPISAGNVRTNRIADVYRSSPLFVRLRDADALGGKCGDCPFRRVCGGSRARAYALSGDYMAEDPLCAFQPPARRRSSGTNGRPW